MPCNDIDERVELTLNSFDQPIAFSLTKKTCGASISQRCELLSYIGSYAANELLTCTLNDLVKAEGLHRQFILDKQFSALKAVLNVYLGKTSADNNALFVLNQIDYDEQGQVHISGFLRIKADTEAIDPCGGCASCSG